MPLLKRLEVWPLYAQVMLRDAAATAFPQWQTGEERVIATAQCLIVGTRGDCDGPLLLEVWKRAFEPENLRVGQPIFEGVLELVSDHVVVGNELINELEVVELGSGRHHIKVYTSPAGGMPEEVYFVID